MNRYIWYSPLKDFWSSYRKLAWVGFESRATEFSPDTLTYWAIRPWVQVQLRASFVQILQYHLFVQCSHFVLGIAFGSRHLCFQRNLAQVVTLVADYTYIYIYYIYSGFNIYIYIYIYIQDAYIVKVWKRSDSQQKLLYRTRRDCTCHITCKIFIY